MTDEEFIRIKTFLKNKYGIDMKGKKKIVEGRLENYLRSNGWSSYSQYMNDVEEDITGKLEKQFVNILTTNHTYFMREAEHFEFLRREVLPYLKKTQTLQAFTALPALTRRNTQRRTTSRSTTSRQTRPRP